MHFQSLIQFLFELFSGYISGAAKCTPRWILTAAAKRALSHVGRPAKHQRATCQVRNGDLARECGTARR